MSWFSFYSPPLLGSLFVNERRMRGADTSPFGSTAASWSSFNINSNFDFIIQQSMSEQWLWSKCSNCLSNKNLNLWSHVWFGLTKIGHIPSSSWMQDGLGCCLLSPGTVLLVKIEKLTSHDGMVSQGLGISQTRQWRIELHQCRFLLARCELVRALSTHNDPGWECLYVCRVWGTWHEPSHFLSDIWLWWMTCLSMIGENIDHCHHANCAMQFFDRLYDFELEVQDAYIWQLKGVC